MNCRNFPEIAASIARAELIDAATLEEARAHSDVCVTCSARLADEMRLTEGLKLLAKSDESLTLRGFDETRLREAFRANVAGVSPARRRSFPFIRLAAGIAAAVVVALGAAILLRPAQDDPVSQGVVARVTPTVQVERPSVKQEPAQVLREDIVSPMHGSVRSNRVKSRGQIDGSYVEAQLTEFTAASLEPEETTEFIPTIQSSNFAPLSSGQVMRVMVPKSAMSYFGLPVNVDRANERVAADVLLGEDGLARAIRFVR